MKYYKIIIAPLNNLNQIVVNDESTLDYVMVESDAELQEKINDCLFSYPLGYVEKKTAIVNEISPYEYIDCIDSKCRGKIVVDYIDRFYTGSLDGEEIKKELEARINIFFK